MPASRGLFSGAISQSGSCEWVLPYDRAITLSESFSARIGCHVANAHHPVLSCLRNASISELLGEPLLIGLPTPLTVAERMLTGLLPGQSVKTMITPAFPVIDKSPIGLSGRPIDIMRSGNFNNVPLIMGTNKDEFKLYHINPYHNANSHNTNYMMVVV